MEENSITDSPRPPQLDWTTSDFSQSNNRFPPAENGDTKVEAEDHKSAPKPGSDVTPQLLGRLHLEHPEDTSFVITPSKHSAGNTRPLISPRQPEGGEGGYSQDKNNAIPKQITSPSSSSEEEATRPLLLDHPPAVKSGATTPQSLHAAESDSSSSHRINIMHHKNMAEQKVAEVIGSEDDLAVSRERDSDAVPEDEDDDWEGPDVHESIKLFIADKQVKEGDANNKDPQAASKDDGSAFPQIDEHSVMQHKKTTHWDTAEDRVTRHRLEWKGGPGSALSQSTVYFSSVETATGEAKTEDKPVAKVAAAVGEAVTDVPSSVHSNDNTDNAATKQKTAVSLTLYEVLLVFV